MMQTQDIGHYIPDRGGRRRGTSGRGSSDREIIFEPVMWGNEMGEIGRGLRRISMRSSDAIAWPRKLLPLPDVGTVYVDVIRNTIRTEKSLQVAFIFSQSICGLKEILMCQKGEEVRSYDEHEFGRKTSRRADDVVNGGELWRDSGESGMQEGGFGDVESHGSWELGKACWSEYKYWKDILGVEDKANPDPLHLALWRLTNYPLSSLTLSHHPRLLLLPNSI